MRSRYAAFAIGDAAHLRRSWAPETRPRTIHLDPARTWTELEVREVSGGGVLDQEGVVAFVARYVDASGPGATAERSTFRRDAGGRWVYVDGAPLQRQA